MPKSASVVDSGFIYIKSVIYEAINDSVNIKSESRSVANKVVAQMQWSVKQLPCMPLWRTIKSFIAILIDYLDPFYNYL